MMRQWHGLIWNNGYIMKQNEVSFKMIHSITPFQYKNHSMNMIHKSPYCKGDIRNNGRAKDRITTCCAILVPLALVYLVLHIFGDDLLPLFSQRVPLKMSQQNSQQEPFPR